MDEDIHLQCPSNKRNTSNITFKTLCGQWLNPWSIWFQTYQPIPKGTITCEACILLLFAEKAEAE